MELKVEEKPRVGIISTETKRLHTTAYSKRVGFGRHFGEGLWKKFDTKFEFLWELAYRIIKTSHREKEIFNTRYRAFFMAVGRLFVVWNEPEKKKKKKIFILNIKCGYFVHKLFHITSCIVTVQRRVNFLLVPIQLFIFFIYVIFYSVVSFLFYVHFLKICVKIRIECLTLPAKRNICNAVIELFF